MALGAELTGRSFPPTPAFTVTAQSLQDFAAAIGANEVLDDGLAPPTYPIVVAFPALQRLIDDPDIGVALHRLVHGGQRFEQHRPVRAGDVLIAQLRVDSVRSLGGADIITTRTDITTRGGEPVCTAYATLVHRAAEDAA